MPTPTLEFRRVPEALCCRIAENAALLRLAETPDDTVRLLFMIHCELKDAEASLPPPVVTLDTLRAEFVRAQDNVAALRARIEEAAK